MSGDEAGCCPSARRLTSRRVSAVPHAALPGRRRLVSCSSPRLSRAAAAPRAVRWERQGSALPPSCTRARLPAGGRALVPERGGAGATALATALASAGALARPLSPLSSPSAGALARPLSHPGRQFSAAVRGVGARGGAARAVDRRHDVALAAPRGVRPPHGLPPQDFAGASAKRGAGKIFCATQVRASVDQRWPRPNAATKILDLAASE